MKTTWRIFLLAVVVALPVLAGDLTITYKAKTKGPMGMNSEGVQTHYYSTKFQKTVDEGTKIDTLVDYEKGVFYSIHHKDKKIELMTFDDMVAIGQAATKQMESMENMPAFMKSMMGGGDAGEINVESLGSDTVAGRACKKYKLSLGKLVDDLSVDPTLKPPVNPVAFAKFQKLRGNQFQGPSSASMRKLYEELAKIKGLPLKTHMVGFMGMDVSTEATEVKTADIPASTFELPVGYKTEDQGKKLLKNQK